MGADNQYKHRQFLKLRKLTSNNRTGDVMGFTVPQQIADKFSGCFFNVSMTSNTIIFTSGCVN